PATSDARQKGSSVLSTAANCLTKVANKDHVEGFETPGAHRYRGLDDDNGNAPSVAATAFRILRDAHNTGDARLSAAATVKGTFFTYNDNDFVEVSDNDDDNQPQDGELVLASKHVEGNHVTATPAALCQTISACDNTNPPIQIQGKHAQAAIEFRQKHQMLVAPVEAWPRFTLEILGTTIMQMIVIEDLPISIIDTKSLRNVILVCRESLRDDQIVHRTTLTKMILKSCLIEQHVMKKEFTGSMGKFSFTTDGWTTCTLFPFIAVIAHWMQAVPIKDTKLQEQLIIESNLVLRSDLIGFYGLPISHTGQHLAATLIHILH
ncbi:hypothetical protein PQX77_011996, partial [Marasmius sp. AFHP31]